MARIPNPEADALLDEAVPVLDKGFVRLVDYLGGDARIVQAARVSYGDGTKTVREDRALIDYLVRNKHTSPLEMVELTFHVKAPIFVARQWLRHRTACLAGNAELYFDEPAAAAKGRGKLRKMSIAEFHRTWTEGLVQRDRLKRMRLRMCDERTGEIVHTRVRDVWRSGVKPVFAVTLENGYRLEMSADHRCLTERGWMTLARASGLRLRDDGGVTRRSDAPALAVNGVRPHADPSWLAARRAEELNMSEIADRATSSSTGLVRTFSPIASIEYVGEVMTFDLEVEGPYRNFVANGFIVHNSVNEISARYSVMRDEFYLPEPEQVRAQGKRSRQVGEGGVPESVATEAAQAFEESQTQSYRMYEELLEGGVAREMAREVLPVGLYTEFYWKQDLHNLLHFLRLRMDWHAQYEIRAYGDAMATMVRAVAPMAYEAFEEHILHARSFARSELELLRAAVDPERLAAALEASGLRKSRRREFRQKLGLDAADDG